MAVQINMIEEKSRFRIQEAIFYLKKQEKEFTIRDRRTSASQVASETREEQALLDTVLFNLRMQHVKVMEKRPEKKSRDDG